ncbi:MAG: SAM-dependent chlorinase/fluorinase, partial [Actinobacteria bacterium]|nr:SAM-dependent chlorinase/fluorinase [Actinomycetota bacterium]
MARSFDTISFLSDLGTADEAVGVVKSVVRDLAPHAVVIDLTHHIPAYDVRAGSLALARAIGYVPSGVVLASVDAGVAATRPLVAIQVANGEGVLVGPDNGVLAPAVAMAGGAERAVLLTDPRFHLASAGGPFATRDVLAPVAAHLCNGIDLAELGDAVDADALLPGVVPLPREAPGGGVIAEVLWVDRLGNCQLNIGVDDVAPWGDVSGARVQVTATDLVRVAERVEHASTLGAGSVGLQ